MSDNAAIQARLVSWAQNEEMIDQYYTQHGKDCIAAAAEIDRLKRELAEKDKRIAELEENIRTVVEDPYYLRFLENALRGKLDE